MKTPRTAYIAAIVIFLIGVGFAVFLFTSGASAFAVAAVSAALVFGAGVCKLVASADDVDPKATDKLSLVSEALTLFGGSAGVLSLVTALSA